MKSTRYSRESRVTTISSIIPLGVIVELSVSYIIFGVALNHSIFNFFIVSLVMIFIVAPRSIKEFLTDYLFIITFTTGHPRLEYLGMINLPNMMSANCPTT